MELVKLLSSVPLFSGLNTDQLTRLTSISRSETFNTDDIIFKQGSTDDRVYIVTRGQVEIRFADAGGGDHAALYLGQGQIFGEMALLDKGARSASVLAIEDGTEVYSITSTALMTLCQQDTAIGFIMMRNLALDLSFKLRHKNLDPTTSI
ncbi:MAG: cyclic nucleotide-binding domain-containing protein [Anaerolineae bacterium]|nr:cyclic nucleotide-binding domain-containing protein [Anaerolineae bacterium]MBN8618859.1 cyclic nucleotide-binding domain-containing protein [Anaerolineae bacterium]